MIIDRFRLEPMEVGTIRDISKFLWLPTELPVGYTQPEGSTLFEMRWLEHARVRQVFGMGRWVDVCFLPQTDEGMKSRPK